MHPSSPTPLEAKTLMYWTLQMHWNGKTHVLKRTQPFIKQATVQSAILDCNTIMSNLDPKRRLSQLAFKLQSEIINKPDPVARADKAAAEIDKLVGMTPNLSA